MKNFCLVALGALLLLSGCGPGPADYGYPVAGGYELNRTSGHEISITPAGGGLRDPSRMILPKVTKLAWDDRYVIAEQEQLKRRNPNNPDCDGNWVTLPKEREDALGYDCYEEPTGLFHYWILDTTVKKTFGPYDKQTFDAERQKLGLGSLVLKEPRAYVPKE